LLKCLDFICNEDISNLDKLILEFEQKINLSQRFLKKYQIKRVIRNMHLTGLKWTKNIKKIYLKNSNETKWAYDKYQKHAECQLFWRNLNNRDEVNADAPNKNEYILLRQHGAITHLVQVMDERHQKLTGENRNEFNVFRWVKIMWITDNWKSPPKIDKFFESGSYFPQSGKAYEIQKLKAFKQRWIEKGLTLTDFQNYIQKELKI